MEGRAPQTQFWWQWWVNSISFPDATAYTVASWILCISISGASWDIQRSVTVAGNRSQCTVALESSYFPNMISRMLGDSVWLILSENSRFSYCLQLKTLDGMLHFPVAFGYFSADVARWHHIKHTDSYFLCGQGAPVIFSLWIFIEIPNASLMNSLEKYDSLQLKLKSQFWYNETSPDACFILFFFFSQ